MTSSLQKCSCRSRGQIPIRYLEGMLVCSLWRRIVSRLLILWVMTFIGWTWLLWWWHGVRVHFASISLAFILSIYLATFSIMLLARVWLMRSRPPWLGLLCSSMERRRRCWCHLEWQHLEVWLWLWRVTNRTLSCGWRLSPGLESIAPSHFAISSLRNTSLQLSAQEYSVSVISLHECPRFWAH